MKSCNAYFKRYTLCVGEALNVWIRFIQVMFSIRYDELRGYPVLGGFWLWTFLKMSKSYNICQFVYSNKVWKLSECVQEKDLFGKGTTERKSKDMLDTKKKIQYASLAG